MQTDAIPDFLTIGHICHDVAPGAYVPGGSVGYAAGFAAAQGCRAAALTSFGSDFLFRSQYSHIALEVVPAPNTTLFENIYRPEGRTQFLHAKAADLSPDALPEAWRSAPVVMLCPIADEVDPAFFKAFKQSFVCACPQGWMRQWDAAGRVSHKPLDFWDLLLESDLVCISENDVGGDWDFIEKVGRKARLMTVTQAADGAIVYQEGQKTHYPAFETEEVNPTGAGDVFAAAFALRYAATREVKKAICYAHAAASFCVERINGQAFQPADVVAARAAQYLF